MTGFGSTGQSSTSAVPAGSAGRSILALAAAACLAPLGGLVFTAALTPSASIAVLALAALLASALCLAALSLYLKPLRRIAAQLEAFTGQAGVEGYARDDYRRIDKSLRRIARRLAARDRRGERHPDTGLPTREALLAAIAADVREREAESLLGVVRFANYERMAAYDAAAANRVLTAFSARLRAALHPSRRVGHLDRDCFGLWFPGVDAAHAAAELKALSYVLAQEIEAETFTVAPDVQVGFAVYPLDAEEPAALLNRAFVSLARPQRSADGRIAFFAPPSREESRRSFALEQQLRHAVRRNELALHYQPLVNTDRGVVIGAEALLRWRHPELGEVPPAQFIRVAEECGLVHEIGLWTMNAACRQLGLWRGTPLESIRLAINLSADQFRDPALESALRRTLASHDIAPSQLLIELTETVAMQDFERTLQLFHQLRELGVGLAIDDFGSGYSSLAYLKRLPFDKLKIDREFVAYVDEREDSRAICRALIELTAGLGISVLAEGVERLEEVETLRRLGCSTFQGYYFSRPLPAAAFAERAADPEWCALLSSGVRRQQNEIRRRLP